MLKAWWNISTRVCCKFTTESISEKSFDNRFILGEVLGESLMSCFFDSQCRFALLEKYRVAFQHCVIGVKCRHLNKTKVNLSFSVLTDRCNLQEEVGNKCKLLSCR